MIIETLKKLFERDLKKLIEEISLYKKEENLWKTAPDISNSGGNLCLHLIGNLNHFICATLGNSGYIRNRELEFSDKDVTQQNIIQSLNQTLEGVIVTLNQVSEDDLTKEYPIVVFNEANSTGFFLIHLATHLNYHLGQINYHRRLLDK